MLLIGFFSSRETLFLLLALRKQPPCIHTVRICWLLKEVFKVFSVPLHLAPNCIYLHPSYPYTKASQVFIFYLALAARSFIPFDFFFFAPQFFSYFHTDPILKYSSCMKFPSTFLKRSHRRRELKGGAERGRTEIQNSMHQCNCLLHLRSDRPDKENWSLWVQTGLTPHSAVHSHQKSELWDNEDMPVKPCCPLTL